MSALEKYKKRIEESGSVVCVGLDADYEKLPERFKKMEYPQFEFNKWIIDETHEYVAAYKSNTAFYEARGDQGIHELKMTMEYLKENQPDIFTILDAKRADIGNTNEGYATFAFDWLGADSITLHPYLGREALEPFLKRTDKVSIILCRTSNKGAGEFQDLESNGIPLWHTVAESVAHAWNTEGNCMLVVGATYPQEMQKVRRIVGDMPLLVPGIGAQGGEVEAVLKAGLTAKGNGLLISSSRAIIFAEDPRLAAQTLCDECNLHRTI